MTPLLPNIRRWPQLLSKCFVHPRLFSPTTRPPLHSREHLQRRSTQLRNTRPLVPALTQDVAGHAAHRLQHMTSLILALSLRTFLTHLMTIMMLLMMVIQQSMCKMCAICCLDYRQPRAHHSPNLLNDHIANLLIGHIANLLTGNIDAHKYPLKLHRLTMHLCPKDIALNVPFHPNPMLPLYVLSKNRSQIFVVICDQLQGHLRPFRPPLWPLLRSTLTRTQKALASPPRHLSRQLQRRPLLRLAAALLQAPIPDRPLLRGALLILLRLRPLLLGSPRMTAPHWELSTAPRASHPGYGSSAHAPSRSKCSRTTDHSGRRLLHQAHHD